MNAPAPTPQTLTQALDSIVEAAVRQAGFEGRPVPPVKPTNNPDHGDYQSNVALRLAKSVDDKIAAGEAIVANLPDNTLIASAEVVRPGFINLKLADDALVQMLATNLESEHRGVPQHEGTAVIDFSSPNIAKRMHVGHLRSTVIGDALHRMHEAAGWRVIADNHLGDWGTQFGKLIVGWRDWRDDEAYAKDPIGELQRIYQRFGELAKKDASLIERARAETAKLQAGDPDNNALWQQFVKASMQEFDAIYARMGIDFDVTLGESFYKDQLQDIVDDLLERDIAEMSEGAAVVRFTKKDGKGLGKLMIVRKADGAANYATTDIATLYHRKEAWAPERVVYVVGSPQALHFKQLFTVARKLGIDGMELSHVGFGLLRFPDGQIASTRAGGAVNLIDVLDQSVAHARALIDEKSEDLTDEERAAIAETVGIGTVKYYDLRQNPTSDITFDWEEALSLNGNTAAYMMYAHARCRSILRKAGQDASLADITIGHPMERELVAALHRLPEVVVEGIDSYRPNLVAEQLFAIANSLSRFYSECRVLGSDEQASRLALVQATADSLEFGLSLLGIDAPERM